jgi:hypothetical protein
MKSRTEFLDAYQWTNSIAMHELLRTMQFQTVDHLQVIYRYRHDPSICVVNEEKSFYDRNRSIFYIHRSWTEQRKYYSDIFHSFARLFVPNHQTTCLRLLGNFLNLLYNEEETNMTSFAKYQQFDLEFNDIDDVRWHLPVMATHSAPVATSVLFGERSTRMFSFSRHYVLFVDETKVRTLLANVADRQEQYQAYQQKKRQEMQTQLPKLGEMPNTTSKRIVFVQ